MTVRRRKHHQLHTPPLLLLSLHSNGPLIQYPATACTSQPWGESHMPKLPELIRTRFVSFRSLSPAVDGLFSWVTCSVVRQWIRSMRCWTQVMYGLAPWSYFRSFMLRITLYIVHLECLYHGLLIFLFIEHPRWIVNMQKSKQMSVGFFSLVICSCM
jgi:hypothetical protein